MMNQKLWSNIMAYLSIFSTLYVLCRWLYVTYVQSYRVYIIWLFVVYDCSHAALAARLAAPSLNALQWLHPASKTLCLPACQPASLTPCQPASHLAPAMTSGLPCMAMQGSACGTARSSAAIQSNSTRRRRIPTMMPTHGHARGQRIGQNTRPGHYIPG